MFHLLIFWVFLTYANALLNEETNDKSNIIYSETWFNPFQTIPNHVVYNSDGSYIAFEQSTIIDHLFLGTFQLVKLDGGSYIVRPIVNSTKYGVIGLLHFNDEDCESFGWKHNESGCFLAIKRVNPIENPGTPSVIIVNSENIEDIFGDNYNTLGKVEADVPMQRLDLDPTQKCLYFLSRNFDEHSITVYHSKFRDFFNYDLKCFSLTDLNVIKTLDIKSIDLFGFLSTPVWMSTSYVSHCLTLVHYDDNGFLVANIFDLEELSVRNTITMGGIQSGFIMELQRTLNTSKFIIYGDNPPYEKILLIDGLSGDIHKHELYPYN